MKRTLLAVLALCCFGLVGCDEETRPSPEVQEAMNKQRQAMRPENMGRNAPQGAPGTQAAPGNQPAPGTGR